MGSAPAFGASPMLEACDRPHDSELSAGSARPTHLCFDGQAELGRYPPSCLQDRKGCREDHLAFFLGALGAFGVKIKHHAAAGKTLYLLKSRAGSIRRTTSPGKTSWAAGGRGIIPTSSSAPPRKTGQGLGGHPGGRPLLLRDRHELRRLGGGPAPAENLHGGVSPLPGVGGPRPRGRARLVIRMEPGLAFGSGYHPTTRTCLNCCAGSMRRTPPGRSWTWAPAPASWPWPPWPWGPSGWWRWSTTNWRCAPAARNLKHNQRRAEVHLIQADARHFAHLPAGLALANIHLDVLLDLLAIPEFLNKDWYIFSGILGAQLESFSSAPEGDPPSGSGDPG